VRAAILFEPDGYLLTGPRLMGRQSAGNGFLRAAIGGRGDQPLTAYSPFPTSERACRTAVSEIDATAEVRWIPERRLDLLAQAKVLYRPDQNLGPMARRRLRAGPGAYSLCGVTHTLSTSWTLAAIADLLVEPTMPWDALICTSAAARSVIETTLAHQADYLSWRAGGMVLTKQPLLPVIPLGVHCEDFAFTPADRAQARVAFGFEVDEIVLLFAGRLSVSGKAHPYPMLRALETAAQDAGRKITLVLAGQPANAAIEGMLHSATADFCPSVRTVFVDGKDAQDYRRAWTAADIFVSLADSIQETFGLTPLEAMAAGLPVLVSDWNGYKDTVRDGVDGFRVPTWAPQPGAGDILAHEFELGALRYEEYLLRANTAVAVDMGELTRGLAALVADEALRRQMGAAGRERARSQFDWAVVYGEYQALWAEQNAVRERAVTDPEMINWLGKAPRVAAASLGPFETFASYPTQAVSAQTIVAVVPGATAEGYRALICHPLLALHFVQPALVEVVLAALAGGPSTVEHLAQVAGVSPVRMTEAVARLAKIDVVTLTGV
jgi:starch synthase